MTQKQKSDFLELMKEAQAALEKAQLKQVKCYNLRRREVEMNIVDEVLVGTHILSSAPRTIFGKFSPKYEGPYEVVEEIR